MYKHFIVAVLCFLPLLAVAQEFGYVNRAEIFQAMPETTEAMKKLDDLAKKLRG
jgi:Skp family chaperone for outer membrane proteins